MAAQQDQERNLEEFCNMCGTSQAEARQYLEASNWDLMAACNSYYQDEDERTLAEDSAPAAEPQTENYTGPRTLDGRPAPQTAARPARSTKSEPKKKGIATLGSLGGSSHHHDDDHDDDDMDDDDDDEGRGNLFAGGEKSGLAVQDPKQQEAGPKRIINDILAKAKANSARKGPLDQGAQAGPSRETQFRGTGVTLGGDGVESRSIPNPNRAASTQPVERILHIWQDGFSVDDGELRRYDDPVNQLDLQMIRSGRAPLHLMNVDNDQPIDVKLHQHDTPYVPQPKKYKPFSGSGHRLGAPVPGDGSAEAAPASTPAAAPSATTTPQASAGPTVDASQPTITIRIQLPDGTRLPARFNTTHTLADVYGFVRGASPETGTRSWVLATTFPNKEHTDQELVLGEMPEFKKGGTAVVKWT
ncbi:putative Cdc48-dependent protein degradation adaptor protein [Stachybotrys elegans]|uniref:Cdc48-dependent protein degradation adaptor protein n=1 Tax=Stachybotrys elegans TaxID=80388 RepID=A0A8K0SW32_9HYPO|nr:putative Cdc48-dependent protein degradation adaptor protein [Stachybotrys elegans]